MLHDHQNPVQHAEVQNASAGGYLLAFLVGMVGMIGAYLLVSYPIMKPNDLLTIISVIALTVGLIQLYFLFNLDFSKERIYHTVSLILTIPLFVMAIGLTLWMFHGLMNHMLLPGVGG